MGSGGILFLLGTGWVCEVQKDGVLRHVYKLPDNCLASCGTHNSLSVYRDVLALTVGRTLYLIDTKCGRELEKIPLKRESLLFVNHLENDTPHLLSDTGLFVVMRREADLKNKQSPGHAEMLSSSAVLVEAVFEEACKYYQQRSLGSTQLTAERLKKGGMFQAPISLAAILRDYLGGLKPTDIAKGNGGSEKLLCSLDSELKSLVALESIKATLVTASEKDLEGLGETLVQQEVSRLLGSDVDREHLLYLNFVFQTFPSEAWRALQAVLQLRCNGEGSMSTKAPAEVWKTVLAPIQSVSNFHHHHHHHNGQQKQAPANVALPVFELLCHSVFRFQPSWLPRFLELAQQQAGSSSSSSTWSYGVKESPESLPLYKRALTVLPDGGRRHQDLEVELLLCSQRPNAVMQALRILMEAEQWERVTRVAERFCRQSPLLNKEIFTTLLCEVSHHRSLDPYLDLLWALCPEDVTVTSILNIVLKNLPSCPNAPGPAGPFPFPNAQGPAGPFPFPRQGSQLTIGLLKPLLNKVLLRETKPSQRYADILQSPTFPPPTPPRRQTKGLPRAATEPALDRHDSKPALDRHDSKPALDRHDSKPRTSSGAGVAAPLNPV
ncbi:Hermansky-Pudlak syndrome 6 protein [Clupea harengus]|uniref:Hermansky-Pudlak syndrome 6 protein n=1 Tax=Clupea harengus TaxID=7950 RepID=A0A6P8GD73_CLUHA|nr:Hermansky-Pudlak syndrome 6 protein [Clupea harengus]